MVKLVWDLGYMVLSNFYRGEEAGRQAGSGPLF